MRTFAVPEPFYESAEMYVTIESKKVSVVHPQMRQRSPCKIRPNREKQVAELGSPTNKSFVRKTKDIDQEERIGKNVPLLPLTNASP